MNLYVYGKTDKGYQEFNDDAILITKIEDYVVAVVADGNGGHQGGINIGMLAINTMKDYLVKIIKPSSSIIDIKNSLELGLYMCSRVLLGINAISEEYSTVYASMTALVISEVSHEMVFASIGNTELQLFRRQKFTRMNHVFSESYEMMMNGKLNEEDFYTHPKRGLLTSALGGFDNIKVDIMQGRLIDNDILFLASDGIFRHITPNEMLELMASQEPNDGVDNVISKCKQLGGHDNLSLICIYVYE